MKNPHAVALGKKGGNARAAALTTEERARIARTANGAAQDRRRDCLHIEDRRGYQGRRYCIACGQQLPKNPQTPGNNILDSPTEIK